MDNHDIYWHTYLNLEKEAIDLSRYIFITDKITSIEDNQVKTKNCNYQLEVFSPYIADLLIRCCVQIEAVSKELYYVLGGSKPRGDSSIKFDEDCLKLVDINYKSHEKIVLVVNPSFDLSKDCNRILRPLKEAHKRQGTYWQRAYQAVKHDRYYNLHKGNVKAFIQALAALYLLNIYLRNTTFKCTYNEIPNIDFGLGSQIFSLQKPEIGEIWYGNNPQESSSPYSVKYQESSYQQILEMQKKEKSDIFSYLSNQPELLDHNIKVKILRTLDDDNNPNRILDCFRILVDYRLQKKVSGDLPFERRKEILLQSSEWNCMGNQRNLKYPSDHISKENIEEVINTTITYATFDLVHSIQKLAWVPFAMSGAICEIFIQSYS